MLFVVRSVRKPGVTNKELIEHFTSRTHPGIWDLIRFGTVVHRYYLTGEDPGFIAVVNVDSIEEVRSWSEREWAKHNLFDVEIVPANLFPEFPAA
jgi:hypothetical protein